ncbi:MAG TPA: glucose 1-dehydrogenase [Solirubrobacteraceae bacterium]|nr:glucose 1-dehydrogenase [Solirubrobacteraceae bacterium]
MSGRLDGRATIVTGVGSGLGREIARVLAAEGAQVLGCDVNDPAGEATMDGIGAYRHADVAGERAVEELVAEAVRRFGRLDVMVNNAAIQIEEELAETTEEQLDRILGVNLKGVFFGCKHAVRAMRGSGGGSIVNIASILALVGDGILAAYCAAKGGVLGITRATAVRYGRDGIRCNAICPGDIDTPLVAAYFATADDPGALRAEVEAEYPLGRIAQPEEIARGVVFLASDDSSFMSGQPLILDGGLLADCY